MAQSQQEQCCHAVSLSPIDDEVVEEEDDEEEDTINSRMQGLVNEK